MKVQAVVVGLELAPLYPQGSSPRPSVGGFRASSFQISPCLMNSVLCEARLEIIALWANYIKQ